jgi:hypothetical protein
LPAAIRHACGLTSGMQLLVVPCPDTDLLVVCPAVVLDRMLSAFWGHSREAVGA